MRMIFSTVFGPHDPALTVGSLAMTQTGRPPTVPLPVAAPSAPRPRLGRRVVGHDADRPPADRPAARDDAVGAEPVLLPVGEQRLLDEGALVEQPVDALAHRELALLGGLRAVALRPARERPAE